ncbi:MAG: hypothetical protein ACPGVS_05120, partial [Primorskyibacter sp.]
MTYPGKPDRPLVADRRCPAQDSRGADTPPDETTDDMAKATNRKKGTRTAAQTRLQRLMQGLGLGGKRRSTPTAKSRKKSTGSKSAGHKGARRRGQVKQGARGRASWPARA